MNLWQAIKLGFAIKREIKHLQGGGNMDYGKMFVKGLKAFGYVAVSILVGALIKGLSDFQPDGDIQNILWKAFGAAIVAGLVSAENWLKHRGSDTAKPSELDPRDR